MSGGHAHALHVHGHSPVHRLAPEVKVGALVAYLLAVVLTPREAMWAFGVHAFLLLAVIVFAELPLGFVLRRMLIEIPFVMFAVLLPFIGGGERVDVGGLALSQDGLWAAWNILVKGTLGVGASVTLVATTEVPDVLRGLDRLRVPRMLTSIAAFMIRYLDVILGELRRMRTAMISRGHDPRWLWQTGAIATSAGALFVRSYERGERVYQAMLARGYTGKMPDLDTGRARPTEWAAAMGVPFTSWLVLALAVVGR